MNKELVELAQLHIEKVRNQDTVMEKELKALEERLKKINKDRGNLKEKNARFISYKPESGICPICWIDTGTSSEFKPLPGDEMVDNFKCTHCGYLLEVAIG